MQTDTTRTSEDKVEMKLKLSVVVISFNMAREIPRTLLSLSPKMQSGMAADDYEIIVVDNGSTRPFDDEACKAISPNIKIIHNDPCGSVSPVGAIKRGLEACQGELIGVLIDGARMASPGLLATALQASQLSARPVIGTLAFHLGPDVQMKSVHNGYDQHAEDALLKTVPWETDGYQLFNISVFAGSSATGWFKIPGETNALFMRADLWSELGGYDQGFQTVGGGLTNHDMWHRACKSRNSDVFLLLGEATFHQFHGGVATNAKVSPSADFHKEYRALRGTDYSRPWAPFKIFGSIKPVHADSLKASK